MWPSITCFNACVRTQLLETLFVSGHRMDCKHRLFAQVLLIVGVQGRLFWRLSSYCSCQLTQWVYMYREYYGASFFFFHLKIEKFVSNWVSAPIARQLPIYSTRTNQIFYTTVLLSNTKIIIQTANSLSYITVPMYITNRNTYFLPLVISYTPHILEMYLYSTLLRS